ncbi:MAG: hypothetical protein ABL874_07865 [Sphingopyxis sp.]
MQVIEILTYHLVAGSGGIFHNAMVESSVPLHHQDGIAIIDFGPSNCDQDQYILIRRFESIETMEMQLAAFYASAAWKNGPRMTIISNIETSHRIIRNAAGFALAE